MMLSSNEVSNCCDDRDSNERERERDSVCVCVSKPKLAAANGGGVEYLWWAIASKQATRKLMKKPTEERRSEASEREQERGISEVLARCLDSLGIIPFGCLRCGNNDYYFAL